MDGHVLDEDGHGTGLAGHLGDLVGRSLAVSREGHGSLEGHGRDLIIGRVADVHEGCGGEGGVGSPREDREVVPVRERVEGATDPVRGGQMGILGEEGLHGERLDDHILEAGGEELALDVAGPGHLGLRTADPRSVRNQGLGIRPHPVIVEGDEQIAGWTGEAEAAHRGGHEDERDQDGDIHPSVHGPLHPWSPFKEPVAGGLRKRS